MAQEAGEAAVDDGARLARLADAGKEALEQARFDVARERLRSGLELAEILQDEQTAARFSFLLGRTDQESAALARNEGESSRLLRSAVSYYENALQRRQDSGPILNNLARAYAQLGMPDRAASLYQRAIRLNDENQPAYLVNYAELLVDRGDPRGAERAYRMLAERVPGSIEAHAFLVEFYVEGGSDQLASYLWSILESGQILRAQESALLALQKGRFQPSAREELLAIAASALARQTYDPAEFLRSDVAGLLQALVEDPTIGGGVRGLLALHRPGGWKADVRWWIDRGAADRDPPRGKWPRDVVRELMRSTAGWYWRNGDYATAQLYLEAAANAVPGEVDPRALRDLVRTYLEQGDLARVEWVAERYESELLGGKADAYRASQLERIYEYHRTLGELYATLERWGDERTVNSAIFQLEHARQAAERLEAREGADRTGELRFGPEQANLLSRGYVAVGDTSASVRTRIDAAERYERADDVRAAAKVLEPLETAPAEKIEAVDRPRYERLRGRVLQRPPPDP